MFELKLAEGDWVLILFPEIPNLQRKNDASEQLDLVLDVTKLLLM